MKWSAFLLGVYLLLLSFLPCADSRECIAPEGPRISALSGHEGHQHPQESCTPFCMCACCGTTILFQQVTLFPVPHTVLPQRPSFAGETSFLSYDFRAIWQPPQLRA
ncbi:DUF6660 family protein [Taibaiella chishuiensis]|uniref:Uncharacterized protein n=1 Tax=Taibaiella chishuiensis TaxID=1434707 RepID=A0A2P8CVZ2_9BACT|nr:DUF6660 family protein [Taibaiella chishuiensis]PSK89120.1 hypothetical protein B0I18_113132 [Taibaiella chishuiensis]